jgi:hypothetical protein
MKAELEKARKEAEALGLEVDKLGFEEAEKQIDKFVENGGRSLTKLQN